MRLRVPSLISPPEASLPEPASGRGRFWAVVDVGSLLLRMVGGGCCCCCGGMLVREEGSGAEEEGTKSGDIGRERGLRVEGWGWDEEGGWRWFCFRFLREDSLPLASEALGELGRLMLFDEVVRLKGWGCLLARLEGVLLPEEGLEAFAALDFSRSDVVALRCSSSFLRSSSFRRSVSVSSDSLYGNRKPSMMQ